MPSSKQNFWQPFVKWKKSLLSSEDFFDTAYERAVEKARRTESSEVMENLSTNHATVVMENLFQLALDKGFNVNIVSGELHAECYDKLVAYLEKMKNKKLSVRVIVTNKNVLLNDNSFAKEMKEKGFLIKQLYDDSQDHFMTVGDQAFRYELVHAATKAKLSFNMSWFTKELNEQFDKLYEQAHSLKV